MGIIWRCSVLFDGITTAAVVLTVVTVTAVMLVVRWLRFICRFSCEDLRDCIKEDRGGCSL
jgi:hypothetical protein